MYAVRKGRVCGKFNTWDEVKKSVNGFSGAEYKKVANDEEAEVYLSRGSIKSKFVYAIKQTGELFNNWEDCRKAVEGKSNVDYKKFKSIDDAKAWIVSNITPSNGVIENVSLPTVYVGGSSKEGVISFGVVIVEKDNITQYRGRTTGSLGNISGEISAVLFSLHTLVEKGITEANIKYNFEGIYKWLSGEWKAKSDEALEYASFVNDFSIRNKLNLYYSSASSNDGNKKTAVKLAKQALNDGVFIPMTALLHERIDVNEVQSWS